MSERPPRHEQLPARPEAEPSTTSTVGAPAAETAAGDTSVERSEVLERLRSRVSPSPRAIEPEDHNHAHHGSHHDSRFMRYIGGPFLGIFGVLFSHIAKGVKESAEGGFGGGGGHSKKSHAGSSGDHH
jgi:hypothetical protein